MFDMESIGQAFCPWEWTRLPDRSYEEQAEAVQLYRERAEQGLDLWTGIPLGVLRTKYWDDDDD